MVERLGNLFSEVVLKYFSLKGLQDIKLVSKFWYQQSKRSFNIQFHVLRSCMVKALKQINNADVIMDKLVFCNLHQSFMCDKRWLKKCDTCETTFCNLKFRDTCHRCRKAKICQTCKTLSVEVFKCACEMKICKDCFKNGHTLVKCRGVAHNLLVSVLPPMSACNQSMCKMCEKREFLCYFCNNKTFCVRVCLRHSIKVFFCEHHERDPCPMCEAQTDTKRLKLNE
jgi:hypothetical protein